jgi:hypothetical protein
VRKLVQLSLSPMVLSAVAGAKDKKGAWTAFDSFLRHDFSENAQNFITSVLVKANDKGVVDGVKLLRSLFRSFGITDPRRAYRVDLHPALDAMCYDACRVIRRGNADTVMMHPDAMKALCEYLLTLQLDNQKEFVEATKDFAQQLVDAVEILPKAGDSGKDFETLMMRLLRCVLLCSEGVSARSLFAAVGRDFKDFPLPALTSVPEVKAVCAFPRASQKVDKTYRNVECDPHIPKTLAAACVCAPTDPYNVLLDFAVVVPRKNVTNVCFAVQAKEYAVRSVDSPDWLPEALSRWRNRMQHLNSSGTKNTMDEFIKHNELVWVLVLVNMPQKWKSLKSENFLQADEALLTLEHAKQWCPSLVFAETAIAFGGFTDE